MLGLVRFSLIVGLVLSGTLGALWALDIAQGSEAQETLKKVWVLVSLLTAVLLGVFVLGRSAGPEGAASGLDRHDIKKKRNEDQ
jgi:hypothetical protein